MFNVILLYYQGWKVAMFLLNHITSCETYEFVLLVISWCAIALLRTIDRYIHTHASTIATATTFNVFENLAL